MIPKVIHWCWFGRGALTPLVERCMASWRRVLPEYEIKVWNEENFDVMAHPYVAEAYQAKKWAFVADYVRVYALYQEGGVYLDTDVEVVRPLDEFLTLPAFAGFEEGNYCSSAVMGSEKGGAWVKALLEDYEGRHFVTDRGTLDLTTNVVRISALMRKRGLELTGERLDVEGWVTLFPQDYFCPKSYERNRVELTPRSCTIHHFACSWYPWRDRVLNGVRLRVGALPAKVLALLWMRPDRSLRIVWRRLLGRRRK